METQKKLAFLLFAIFLISAVYSFFARIQPYGDAQAYDRIGWNLARGLGYIEHEKNAENIRADDAIFRVGPGYEFFLAGIYRVFGHRSKPVWVIHAFLRMLTAFLLFKISLLLFSDHQKKEFIGFAAAAIFGFFPDLILINGFLLYETLLLFLGVAAVYFSLKTVAKLGEQNFWIQKILFPELFIASLASLFWALAILTRPSELLPFLVFPAALLITKQPIRYTALSFLFPILLVGGWSLRNSLIYDQPLFTTTAGAYALWVGNNAKASGGYDRSATLQEARDRYHSTELSRVSLKNTIAFIRHRPLKFLELQFKKTIIYFSLIRPTGFWPHLHYTPLQRLFIIGASTLATAFLFILGAAGARLLIGQAWTLWRKKDAVLLTFYGFMLAKPFAVIPFYVETRYRYSLYPLLTLYAAISIIAFLLSPKKSIFLKTWIVIALIFLLLSAIDMWYSFNIIMNRLPTLL